MTARQKITKRSLAIALPLLAVGALLLGVQAASPPPRDGGGHAAAPPLSVQVVTAEGRDGFERQRTLSGQVLARRRSALAFELAGRLVEITADDGHRVAAGVILARLDDRSVQLELAGAEAQLAEARAREAELKAGPRAEVIAAARAALAGVASDLELARRRVQRREELVAVEALAAEEAEAFAFEVAGLVARHDEAEARLTELLAGTRPEVLAAQSARVATLEARCEGLRIARDKHVLRAPFAGTVTGRAMDEGAVLTPGTPVLHLVEAGALEARIGLTDADEAPEVIGEEVMLRVGDRVVTARYRALAPEVDPITRTPVALFDLATDAQVLPGELISWESTQAVAAPGIWLPRTALRKSLRGLWAVYVVEGDPARIARRAVEILHEDGARVFVRGTLKAGESVLPDGGARVVAGQPVQVEGAPR